MPPHHRHSHALPQVSFLGALQCCAVCSSPILFISVMKKAKTEIAHDEVSHGMTWIAISFTYRRTLRSDEVGSQYAMKKNMHEMWWSRSEYMYEEKNKKKKSSTREIEFPYLDLWQEELATECHTELSVISQNSEKGLLLLSLSASPPLRLMLLRVSDCTTREEKKVLRWQTRKSQERWTPKNNKK